jgi:predicted amidohydrolase YtcJ
MQRFKTLWLLPLLSMLMLSACQFKDGRIIVSDSTGERPTPINEKPTQEEKPNPSEEPKEETPNETISLNLADTVFTNAEVYTVDNNNPWAEAIAVKDGEIIYVGLMAGIDIYIGEHTKVIDLKGKMVMPAFVDSHLHPLSNSYAMLYQVALFNLTTLNEYSSAIKAFAKKNPGNEWVVGAGFDEWVFGNSGPTKEALDKIMPNRPVAIVDRDIHSMLVNSKALEVMGINRNTQDPDGGSISRDRNGDAAGVLVDDAAMEFAYEFFPEATKEEYKASLLWMQKWLSREGITTAHDAWVEFDPNYYEAFDELAKEGKLNVRYRGSWFIDPNGNFMNEIDNGLELSKQFTHPHFKMQSFKFLTDNVLEQDSALLIENGRTVGVRNWKQSDMVRAYSKVDKAGHQLHVHVVGDGGVRVTLDAIESANKANGVRDARHSFSHVEVAAPEDIKRMGRLGVSAHLTTIALEKEPETFEKSDSKFHPVKSLIDVGAKVTIASDYATSDPDVLGNIFGAIARDNGEGASLKEMIKAATINSAHANFLENEVGSLALGKKADIIVLSKNLFEIPKRDIPSVNIEMTFFEGKQVH